MTPLLASDLMQYLDVIKFMQDKQCQHYQNPYKEVTDGWSSGKYFALVRFVFISCLYAQNILECCPGQMLGARCSSVVRAFAHGAMGHQIVPSWWTHQGPRLV